MNAPMSYTIWQPCTASLPNPRIARMVMGSSALWLTFRSVSPVKFSPLWINTMLCGLSHNGLLIVECRRRVVASRIHRLTSLANFSSFQHVDTGRPFRVIPESTSAANAFPSAGMFLAKGSSWYVLLPLLHIKLENRWYDGHRQYEKSLSG